MPVWAWPGVLLSPAAASESGPEGRGVRGEGNPSLRCSGECAVPLLLKDSLFWSDRSYCSSRLRLAEANARCQGSDNE